MHGWTSQRQGRPSPPQAVRPDRFHPQRLAARGYLLPEALIALGLLGMALLPLASVGTQALAAWQQLRQLSTALALAAERAELATQHGGNGTGRTTDPRRRGVAPGGLGPSDGTPRAPARQRGWTLLELLVGLALGTTIAVAATVTALAVQRACQAAAAQLRLEQQGRHALDVIAHLVRHAGWRTAGAVSLSHPLALMGRDDCGQPVIGATLDCRHRGVGASDALLVRFGAADPDDGQPDAWTVDCSGFPVPAPGSSGIAGERDPGAGFMAVNLLYVSTGSDGEPQLLCRYRGRHGAGDGVAHDAAGWTSAALARGVETMQLRFGLDRDGDGVIDAFVRAAAIVDAEGWRAVRAVRVALVLRAPGGPAAPAAGPAPLALMPPLDNGESDSDTRFIPDTRWGWTRRAFVSTVMLRNPAAVAAPHAARRDAACGAPPC